MLPCSRSSNSTTTHTLIIFPFYIAYLWVDSKLLQIFTAVVVKKYSSPHWPYIVPIEMSCLPWWLCSYFIHFFCPYFFLNILIASVKIVGLLGVLLPKPPHRLLSLNKKHHWVPVYAHLGGREAPLIDSPLFPHPEWGSFFMGCCLQWNHILTSSHQIRESSALLCFNMIHECLRYRKKGIKGLHPNPKIAGFF